MRPFIQTTAGATFFLGIPHTLMFRKDYVEIIFNGATSSSAYPITRTPTN